MWKEEGGCMCVFHSGIVSLLMTVLKREYKEFQCYKSLLPLLQSTPDLVLLLPEVIDTKSQWLMQTSFYLTSIGGVVEK